MQKITNISDRLMRSLRGEGEPQIISSGVSPGISSSTDVAVMGLASGSSVNATGTLLQAEADKGVFEGSFLKAASSTWSATEVVGDKVGVRAKESGLVAEFVVCAPGSQEFPATRLSDLKLDNTGDWQVGPEIDLLASTLETGGSTVYAMPLFAKMGQKYDEDNPEVVGNLNLTIFTLDGIYSSIVTGSAVVIEVAGTEHYGAEVVAVGIAEISPIEGVVVPVTQATVHDLGAKFGDLIDTEVRIWFDAKKAGTLERIPTRTVTKGDFLNAPRPVTLPPDTLLPVEDTFIVIQDAEGTTLRAKGGGSLVNDIPHVTITELLEEFDGELVKPITFLWGLTKVTRGETVHREVIGSGDAMQRWQSFRLAKSPLTYVADPFAPGGRRAEIEVFVNGLKWSLAQSFYKAGPKDEIYVIRHDADHQTFVQFGDGELGKRLPTGSKNVVATYRHGVGGNVEANTITQLERPIKGVTSVNNPLPATGGEDPPTEAEAREKAIQSTRVLGRLVSVVDFEVEAARYGGVIRAKALWGWDKAADDAVVKVWIICADEGDPSADLRTYLTKMAEPEVRVEVYKATKYARELTINLELDPNYLPEEVNAAIHARLFDEFDGLLAPRNVPIGGVFHRSELYGAMHEIAGVLSVQSLFVDNDPMPKRITLAEGEYLALTSPEAV